MRILKITLIIFTLTFFAVGANAKTKQKMTHVLIETSLGEIKVVLYNETPLHRDNFIKLIEENFYDSLLFHRVIRDFMIQTGDPKSKFATENTPLGAGGNGYNVPAEIIFPQLYHKRGALAAARQGDMYNPERKSSGCQFYIVQGKTCTDQELDMIQNRINASRSPENQFKYSAEQRIQYKSFGGTPHLDDQYTVFGEVVSGFEILQLISEAETGMRDKPKTEIRIISTKIVKK